ncbi:LOW QUALITY PROTEIN: hypothetical protein PHMEG_00037032 [Phytophthora megakarya]|uniref:Uncharacterized protein n=1 Tax=Phytophthora megakarya TaxID=4795 RepID=A0A225UKT6_9STRA|nr:LOW QUALITY PROTEIN: hypothetical protein PHMEG_00037032 [Phytophthora megakarya]
MEGHWGKKSGYTRVFYLQFTTSDGNSVSARTKTDNNATVPHLMVSSKSKTMKIRNWVDPTIEANSDTACSRPIEPFNSSKVCPQNDDRTLEITQKTVAVVAALANVATTRIFGASFTGYKKAKELFLCAVDVGVIRSLIYYIRFQQTTTPQGAVEEMLALAYQSLYHCLGIPVPANLQVSGVVIMIVEAIVKQAIMMIYHLLQNTSAVSSTHSSAFLDTNSTCGYQLKRITDRVVRSVNIVHDKNVKISRSLLVLKDIPAATNNCMHELLSYKTEEAAFNTRDLLRKTFGVIVDQLIETATTDLGKFVAEKQYMLEATNLGSFSQLVDLLPLVVRLTTAHCTMRWGSRLSTKHFSEATGPGRKKRDGVVNLIFTSIDTKDVTVVVHSGGEDIAEVEVNLIHTATWNSTVSKLHDKVLYLDRWRPNVSGSGGRSLKLWVPRASKGGHRTLYILIYES